MQLMKILLLLCSTLLFLSLANLPIGYFTLLRIIVTIGSVVIVVTEFEHGFNFWVIAFCLMGILFNPLIPIYFNDKSTWVPIDIIAGILFATKAFYLRPSNNSNGQNEK